METHGRAPRRLILVAEDDAPIRAALSGWLEDEGYRIHVAGDGLEALEMAASLSPDLIVSDVRMPRVDGLELVSRLRAGGRDVPVVLISAHYAGVDVPGVRFVAKPFDMVELAKAIEHGLAAGGRGRVSRRVGVSPLVADCGDEGVDGERLAHGADAVPPAGPGP